MPVAVVIVVVIVVRLAPVFTRARRLVVRMTRF
jgi:hypothetical protein